MTEYDIVDLISPASEVLSEDRELKERVKNAIPKHKLIPERLSLQVTGFREDLWLKGVPELAILNDNYKIVQFPPSQNHILIIFETKNTFPNPNGAQTIIVGAANYRDDSIHFFLCLTLESLIECTQALDVKHNYFYYPHEIINYIKSDIHEIYTREPVGWNPYTAVDQAQQLREISSGMRNHHSFQHFQDQAQGSYCIDVEETCTHPDLPRGTLLGPLKTEDYFVVLNRHQKRTFASLPFTPFATLYLGTSTVASGAKDPFKIVQEIEFDHLKMNSIKKDFIFTHLIVTPIDFSLDI